MDERTEIVCYRHPDRTTRLACSECGRPICVECSHDAAVGQKCPECVQPHGRGRVMQVGRQQQAGLRAAAPVTFFIIAVNVGIFLIGMLSPAAETEFLRRFAQINVLIEAGEWWRVFTAAFLHGGITHILFNMYALYLFGPRIEQQVGPVAFGSLYLASAALGGAVSYALGAPNQVSVGASGAIFGLFGAWIFVAWRMRHTPAGRAMFNQFGVLLLINLALPLFIPRIDWKAHVGGLLAGFAIAALWGRFAVGKPNSRQIRTGIASGIMAVALAIVVVL